MINFNPGSTSFTKIFLPVSNTITVLIAQGHYTFPLIFGSQFKVDVSIMAHSKMAAIAKIIGNQNCFKARGQLYTSIISRK